MPRCGEQGFFNQMHRELDRRQVSIPGMASQVLTLGPRVGARRKQKSLMEYRPLYKQVREELVRRLAQNKWLCGEALPSEFQLADELGVSQGTVRKALASMTVDRLLVRQQGRGTFVSEYDDARIKFHFFKLVPDRGSLAFPKSEILDIKDALASADEIERLDLNKRQRVFRILRLRLLDGRPATLESISVSAALFPNLTKCDMSHNLYSLYAKVFGIKIVGGQERLKAVALNAKNAKYLKVRRGTPALRVERLARDLENKPMEWRIAFCLTENVHYLSSLS
jgi:GntR family transcriptional regulator